MSLKCSFKYLPHTADVYIEVKGDTLEDAFKCVVYALLDVMTDPEKVGNEKCFKIKVDGFDLQSLLYNFIEELLYLFDAEGFLPKKTEYINIVFSNEKYDLKAKICGELFDPVKHESRTLVKAATYHLMEIEKSDSQVIMRFVLDI